MGIIYTPDNTAELAGSAYATGNKPKEVTGVDIPGGNGRAVHVAPFNPNTSIFGEQVVGSRTHDISVAFNYNISDHDVMVTDTGTGVTSYETQTLKVTPGTGVGMASVQSHNTLTYRPGSEAFAMFTMVLENGGEAGLEQAMGIMDVEDGFFIGFNGTTFSVAHRKGSVDTWVPSSSFDGDDISWLDTSKLNIYMIRYGYLGIAPITYWVYHGPTRAWVLIHAVDLTNTQTLTHINTPTLPVCAYAYRAAGSGTATVMRSGSWRGGIVCGQRQDMHRRFSRSNSKLAVTTTLTNIFTLKNKSIYQSVTNKVPAELEAISFASDGTKAVEISVWADATLGGTPIYADIETNNSVMQMDTSGTTVTGGELVFTAFLSKIESNVINLLPYHFKWHPGETLTFAAKALSSTSDISYAVNWGEMF